MKKAQQIVPIGPYQQRLQEFDLREIDAPDPHGLFHRKYLARLGAVAGAIRRELPAGARILEVGCSQANASLLLAEEGYQTVGLDIRADALRYALSKYERGPFFCVAGSAEKLPLLGGSMDAVILGELLEHCADPAAILREASRVVKGGGLVLVTTPNGGYIGNRQPLYDPTLTSCAGLTGRQFGPAGEDHLFAFTRAHLCKLLADCGLDVVRCGYVGSAVYAQRFAQLKRLLSPRRLDQISSIVNRLPVVNQLFSYTLLAMGRKR